MQQRRGTNFANIFFLSYRQWFGHGDTKCTNFREDYNETGITCDHYLDWFL